MYVLFGGFVDIVPYLGGPKALKPPKAIVNRHFQANAQNIKTYILLKLLHQIHARFAL